jgi:hypothetical protein
MGEEVHTPQAKVASDCLEVLDEVACVQEGRVSRELRSSTTPLVVIDDDVTGAESP